MESNFDDTLDETFIKPTDPVKSVFPKFSAHDHFHKNRVTNRWECRRCDEHYSMKLSSNTLKRHVERVIFLSVLMSVLLLEREREREKECAK